MSESVGRILYIAFMLGADMTREHIKRRTNTDQKADKKLPACSRSTCAVVPMPSISGIWW